MELTLPTANPVRSRGLTVAGSDTPWQESVLLPTRVARHEAALDA